MNAMPDKLRLYINQFHHVDSHLCITFNRTSHNILIRSIPLDEFSFPSGHTLHAVIFTLVAIHYYPMLSVALIPFSILIGLSRPILGLHYPSDVLVGALIGFFISLISFYII